MPSYYLWRGVDAVEDIEDCESDEQARNVLASKAYGDWTLWKRLSYQEEVARGVGHAPTAFLMAVKLSGSGQEMNFDFRGRHGEET